MSNKPTREGPCLICKTESKYLVRGLCHKCYQNAFRCVDEGRKTWEQLESIGAALPSRRVRTSKSSAFNSFIQQHEPIKDMGYDFSKERRVDPADIPVPLLIAGMENVKSEVQDIPGMQVQPLGVVPPWAAK